MHASISDLYFSTQAADDATTATPPKTSIINPDSLQGTVKPNSKSGNLLDQIYLVFEDVQGKIFK